MSSSFIRKIIHIDMDCFYAAIEMQENPHLKNKPLAVGGAAERRGVLTTCNYIAREFGLHSAMPTAQALKLCPNLILLPVNMPLYRQVSQQIHQIFQRYTSIIEPLSLDEAYLDVTNCQHYKGSSTWIAQAIRAQIFNELQLTASAGIAPLKFLAKIASDQNKPNGQFVIEPENVLQFIKNLPLSKIPGVGKVTAQRLAQMGLNTCLDIQEIPQHLLLTQFGKMGHRIWQFSHGIDNREVQVNRERKSVGVETTLVENIFQLTESHDIVQKLYSTLLQRLSHSFPDFEKQSLHKIGVKLKFDDFQITTLEKSGVNLSLEEFQQLLAKAWNRAQGRSIRLIGLHLNLPTSKEEKQMSLW